MLTILDRVFTPKMGMDRRTYEESVDGSFSVASFFSDFVRVVALGWLVVREGF